MPSPHPRVGLVLDEEMSEALGILREHLGENLPQAVWLIRGEALGRSRPSGEASPEELLKRRLASGEIDVEEYDRLRRALQDEPAQAAERGGTPALH